MKTKKFLCLFLSFLIIISSVQVYAQQTETDIFKTISKGIGSSEAYITNELTELYNNGSIGYNCEWYIISMLRAGKEISNEILNSYYESVSDTVALWDLTQKPTDVERCMLALNLMGKDITDINGINLAELIYNNQRLTEGSNELAYALIALDSSSFSIPDGALWTRDEIITQLLTFQAENGGFGLYDNMETDVDMTAMCIQALAPYQDDENVQPALNNAVSFLKSQINAEYNYSNDVFTTAQVLLAIASLKIDVTDAENEFGSETSNIITALDTYRNISENGYLYGEAASTKATIDVMQAYDAYRKAHLEDVAYWDFGTEGAKYDDTSSEGNTDTEITPAEPANVYVTIADNGEIVTDKSEKTLAMAPVVVTDVNSDGNLTYDEALYCTHEQYYSGGAELGYSTFTSSYGLSLARLWGKGENNVTASAGYYLNNASCWSLENEVKDGDYLTAFNYKDTEYWSDTYTYFEKYDYSVEQGSSVTLTLNKLGYDENYNTVVLPCADAKIKYLESDEVQSELITNENGKVKLSISSSAAVGTYYVMAYCENPIIVPSVCKITVTEKEENDNPYSPPSTPTISGGGGGNASIDKKDETKDEKAENIENTEEFEKTDKINKKEFTDDTFFDVKVADWHYDAVKYVYENNLMNGTENGFEPDSNMSRAMLVTVLYRIVNPEKAVGDNVFKDVAENDWYTDAVIWASANSIVNGTSENEFEPDTDVTREQMAVIIYRFAKLLEYDITQASDISSFEDAGKVSDFAIDAVKWAHKINLINGTSDTTLSPNETATRAQVATILMRFLNKEPS